MIRLAFLLLVASAFGAGAVAFAQQTEREPEEHHLDAPAPDGIRPGGTLAREFEAPDIPMDVRSMNRPARNYPEQPPVVPHNIRGYQVDKNYNQCLTCHSRSAIETSGAPMISVTHFHDRDGQVLGAVSPRRYFCLKCHVPQQQVTPIEPNTYKGIEQVLQEVIEERRSE